jgi:nicotinamidase-related amidase
MVARSSRTALVILDMVNLFDFEGGRRLAAAAVRIAPNILRLRDRFDRAGAPTIYANDNFAHWQGHLGDLVEACRDAGGSSAVLIGLLAPRAHDYHVLKPKHSAFLSTPLPILLAKLEVGRLVLAGVAADSCVLATAVDANMRELNLWVPRDCVAAMTPKRTTLALDLAARSIGASVQSSRSVEGLYPRSSG